MTMGGLKIYAKRRSFDEVCMDQIYISDQLCIEHTVQQYRVTANDYSRAVGERGHELMILCVSHIHQFPQMHKSINVTSSTKLLLLKFGPLHQKLESLNFPRYITTAVRGIITVQRA